MADSAPKAGFPTKSRGLVGNFDLADEGGAAIYVDGSSGILIGPNVAKITFHTIENVAEEDGVQVEKRKIALKLTIPTLVFLEFLVKNIEALNAAETALVGATDQLKIQLQAFFDRAKAAS